MMIEPYRDLKPPECLTGRSCEWWSEMVEAFDGFEEEPHAREILTQAAVQLGRLEQFRESMADAGPVFRDRFQQPKEHPAAAGERAAANMFRLLCRELGIPPAGGDSREFRPGGRR